MWKRLCNLLGREDLLAMSEFKDNEARSRNRRKLNEILNQAFAAQDSKSWIDELNKAGVPCGPIYKMNEVFADPQVQHLQLTRRVSHPTRDDVDVLRPPLTFSDTPARVRTGVPADGEHTRAVLVELGYSDDEIDDLHASGAVGHGEKA